MTSTVDAKISVGEIALHAVLEGKNISAVLEQLSDDFISRQVSRVLVNISVYTSGVIAQTVSLRVRFDTSHLGRNGPESRGPIRQRSRNTASTASGLELDGAVW